MKELTLLPEDTLASLSVLPVSSEDSRTSDGSGRICSTSWGQWDQGSLSWRTSQASLLPMEGQLGSLEGFPTSGSMRNGDCFERTPASEPLTGVKGSSWSRGEYPTPTASEYGKNQGGGAGAGTGVARESLSTWARNGPQAQVTPTVGPSGSQPEAPRLQLNPEFVEALMGFLRGWTDCEPSAMPLSPNRQPTRSPHCSNAEE